MRSVSESDNKFEGVWPPEPGYGLLWSPSSAAECDWPHLRLSTLHTTSPSLIRRSGDPQRLITSHLTCCPSKLCCFGNNKLITCQSSSICSIFFFDFLTSIIVQAGDGDWKKMWEFKRNTKKQERMLPVNLLNFTSMRFSQLSMLLGSMVNVVVVSDRFQGWLFLKCENKSFDAKLTTSISSSFQFSGQNINSELNGHTNYSKHCFGGFWKILLYVMPYVLLYFHYAKL